MRLHKPAITAISGTSAEHEKAAAREQGAPPALKSGYRHEDQYNGVPAQSGTITPSTSTINCLHLLHLQVLELGRNLIRTIKPNLIPTIECNLIHTIKRNLIPNSSSRNIPPGRYLAGRCGPFPGCTCCHGYSIHNPCQDKVINNAHPE
uniref:Uncharacterized protein n=1 Tax=Branchiostoma floridae TaxID=7739 RepID=C3XTA0_BRAFL|eukprot:XP_002612680.1 hypothetical protein BRAFLDRAFT_106695 [Branchiostoma floridae]